MSHLNVAGWTTGNSDLRTAFISLSNSDIFCVNEKRGYILGGRGRFWDGRIKLLKMGVYSRRER